MHHVRNRPPTDDEKRLLESRAKSDLYGCGVLYVVFAGLSAYGLSQIFGFLGWLFSPTIEYYGKWFGVLLSMVLILPLLSMFWKAARKWKHLAELDLDSDVVEEIQVVTNRVIEIGTEGNADPILAIDLDDRKILYLQGQWLFDPHVYGAAGPENEPDQSGDFLNGLPGPYSFPSNNFTVVRLPSSGDVLRIAVSGDYLKPEGVVEGLKWAYVFPSSVILDGRLDDIAEVLEREHARRKEIDS
jgi:hypothetical protein